MNTVRPILLGVVLTALVAPGPAGASSISVSEVGSRTSGRAGAATALYDSPSTIYYNPANVSRLPGLQVELGVAIVLPRWQFKPLDGASGSATKSEVGTTTPPNLSLSYNLGNLGLGDVAVGLGVYVPYGSRFSWPDDWVGNEEIQTLALLVWEVAPVVAWRPHEAIAIGAGFRLLPGSVYMKRSVNFGSTTSGTAELGGNAIGMGASAGISLWPLEHLSIGLGWRSPATMRFKGVSDLEFPAPFEPGAVDRDLRATIALAQTWRLGVAYDVIPNTLNISADFEIQMWSALKGLSIASLNDDGTQDVLRSPRNCKDTIVVRVGGEYQATEEFAVRLGYAFDQRAHPDDTVGPAPPDSDRHAAVIGLSYDFGVMAVHAYYTNAFFTSRTTKTAPMPGTYKGGWLGNTTMAHLFGLSISTQLDIGGGESPAPTVPSSGGPSVAATVGG